MVETNTVDKEARKQLRLQRQTEREELRKQRFLRHQQRVKAKAVRERLKAQVAKQKQLRQSIKQKALRDYDRGERLEDIAIRYRISPCNVSLWAKAAGRPRRQQGCRTKQWPGPTDIEIVKAVRNIVGGQPTLADIGRSIGGGMTRAGVHRIYQRWKDWKPHLPFTKGDRIRHMERDYEVIKPNIFEGRVRDLKTGEEKTMFWTWKVTLPDGKERTFTAVKLHELNGHRK